MEEKDYYLGFSVFPGIGPAKFKLLLNQFGSAKAAWNADLPDLKNVVGEKLAIQLDNFRPTFSITDYLEKLKQKDVWFITWADNDYPSLLKEIKNSPFVLYGRGNKNILASFNTVIPAKAGIQENAGSWIKSRMTSSKIIAIVGTRKITDYGREVTQMLTRDLVAAGFVIVSGLALGVDSVAHATTIESNGKTIAVLGSGVDYCTPVENINLYQKIINAGSCIVSEYPLGQGPSVGSFPARNRIIAGLSVGVIVTEGAFDSGALITAKDAFENNRKVFAVPGQITSQLSKGPLDLLNKGAKLVTSAKDITSELPARHASLQGVAGGGINKEKLKGDTQEEQKILDILANEAFSFDQIIRLTGIPSSTLSSTLSIMEIKGMIKSLNNGNFTITVVIP